MTTNRREFLVLGGALIAASQGLVTMAFGADKIRIGAIHPYSGPMANYGDESAKGYELAIDKVNAAGGVLGKQIELIRGDAANAQQGMAAVEQLADQVDLFTGTYISAVSNAASDAANQHQKIYWDTEALAQNLTERGLPNFVRSGPDAATFGRGTVEAVLKMVVPTLKKDAKDVKVWIEHETTIYGTSIADTQEALFKQAGIQVVGRGSHAYDAIDLNDSILRAKNANPDIWVQTGYVEDGNLLLRTAAEQGFKPAVRVMTGVGSSPETLEALGAEALEGMLVVAYPRTDTNESFAPGVGDYLAAYKKKFGREPLAPDGLTCYVGMQMLLETIQAAGDVSVEKIRAAAAKMDKPISSYANGSGLKFDEKFQNTRALSTAVQWQSGQPVTVYPFEAAPTGTKLVPFSKS